MSRFDYVKYDDNAEKMQAGFKSIFIGLTDAVEALPKGRAQSIALTKLEEAYMWIGKAIRDNQIERNGAAELMEQRKSDPSQMKGQHENYETHTGSELEKPLIRPFRSTYKHNHCGNLTSMGSAIAMTYARDPKFYSHTYCAGCDNHYPVSEFKWEGTDEQVGS